MQLFEEAEMKKVKRSMRAVSEMKRRLTSASRGLLIKSVILAVGGTSKICGKNFERESAPLRRLISQRPRIKCAFAVVSPRKSA